MNDFLTKGDPTLNRDEAQQLELTVADDGRMMLAVRGGAMRRHVHVRRAAPLSDPDCYIVFVDDNGREICLVREPRDLSHETRAVVRAALDRQYLTAKITAVLSVRIESEVSYLEVETSRGRRHFAIQHLDARVRRLKDRRLLLVDIDGNWYEIDDPNSLDRRSLALLKRLL